MCYQEQKVNVSEGHQERNTGRATQCCLHSVYHERGMLVSEKTYHFLVPSDSQPTSAAKEKELRQAAAIGGTVDLRGAKVALSAPLVITSGVDLRIQHGTLMKAVDAQTPQVGPAGSDSPLAIEARGSGTRLSLRSVRLVRVHLVVAQDAHGAFKDCSIIGIEAEGEGTEVTVDSGRVLGTEFREGLSVTGGAKVMLRGVEIKECTKSCVAVAGQSVVVVRGGKMRGSKGACGVDVGNGGRLICERVDLSACAGAGVLVRGTASHASLTGGRVHGSMRGPGVLVQGGASATLRAVEVSSSCGSGVAVDGGTVELAGCFMRANRQHGVDVAGGGSVAMCAVDVSGSRECGVVVRGKGSRAYVIGGSVSGSKRGHGVVVAERGSVEMRDVVLTGNAMAGVWVHGHGSAARVHCSAVCAAAGGQDIVRGRGARVKASGKCGVTKGGTCEAMPAKGTWDEHSTEYDGATVVKSSAGLRGRGLRLFSLCLGSRWRGERCRIS